MGTFFDGNDDNQSGAFDELGKAGLSIGGLLFKQTASSIRDVSREIQKARDKVALAQAAEDMRRRVQSPGSPEESPASMAPVLASPDFSPPPRRMSNTAPSAMPVPPVMTTKQSNSRFWWTLLAVVIIGLLIGCVLAQYFHN